MPYTRMFQTVTSSILHRAPPGTPADEKIDSEDEQPLAEIIASIINTRLRKLVGLRTGIRRLPLARRTLKTAPHAPANSELAQAEALRPPITRLNSHQNFIMSTFPLATLGVRVILLEGTDAAMVCCPNEPDIYAYALCSLNPHSHAGSSGYPDEWA